MCITNLFQNLGENGLDWLCYLAGNFQTAPTIFFIFSGYFFWKISLRTHKPEMPAHFCHLIFQLWVVCFHTCILFSGRHKYNLIPTTKKDKLMKNAKVKTDRIRMLLLNDPYTTFSGHFFDICMFIFPKPEVQTVILICSTGLNFNWFKSYGLKCSLRPHACLANSQENSNW